MNKKIQEIYNLLHDFESTTKIKKRKNRLYPIHKRLQFKEEKYNDISDWIIDHLQINKNDSILDAGCGVGYVLTKVCKSFNCSGLGISLSEKEIVYASNINRELGLDNQVSFKQMSFDEKFNDKFDVIIAIESIKHSDSIQNTIENLVKHLKTDGRIFILDDYITDSRFQFLKKQVKKYWAVRSFYTINAVEEKLAELNLPFKIIDFTPNVGYAKKDFTGVKVIFTYLFLFFVRLFPFYKVYNIYFAGFCLERLYKKGALEYKAIIGTNSN